MKRTEVQIPDKQWQILATLSKEKGKSITELIKDAIGFILVEKKTNHFESSLNNAFGLWENRKDINSTENYIRKLRKGKRLESFYAKSSH